MRSHSQKGRSQGCAQVWAFRKTEQISDGRRGGCGDSQHAGVGTFQGSWKCYQTELWECRHNTVSVLKITEVIKPSEL